MNPKPTTPAEADTFERDPFPQPRTIPNGWIVEAIYEGESSKADCQPHPQPRLSFESNPR